MNRWIYAPSRKEHASPLYGLAAVIAIMLLCSCSSHVNYDAKVDTGVSKGIDCDLDIAVPPNNLKGSIKEIGHVYIGDTGFSLDCGWDTVMRNLREKACAAGADAVQVTSVKPPDFWSTCYRMDANFYVYTGNKSSPDRQLAKQKVQEKKETYPYPPEVRVATAANSTEDEIRSMEAAERPFNTQTGKSTNYALLIGNNNYKYMSKLETARQDVHEISTLLEGRFGFTVKVLLDAGRDQIIRELNATRKKLGENDFFLLYYAGHGHFDTQANKAYWLPVDARVDEDTEWIIVDTITSNLKRMAPKHILVVADSCYSGAMTRGILFRMESAEERNLFMDKMQQRPSRTLLSSGGNEPVADGGGSGHSVFAKAFISGLENMNRPKFTASQLFYEYIREGVAGNSDQVPEYNVIRNSGHDGGDFIFHRQ